MSGSARPDPFIDAGQVSAAGARNAGCRFCTPSRTAQGIFVLTFGASQGFDDLEGSLAVTHHTAGIRDCQVVHTSDVAKTINFLDAAAAAQDSIFSFLAYRYPGGD